MKQESLIYWLITLALMAACIAIAVGRAVRDWRAQRFEITWQELDGVLR